MIPNIHSFSAMARILECGRCLELVDICNHLAEDETFVVVDDIRNVVFEEGAFDPSISSFLCRHCSEYLGVLNAQEGAVKVFKNKVRVREVGYVTMRRKEPSAEERIRSLTKYTQELLSEEYQRVIEAEERAASHKLEAMICKFKAFLEKAREISRRE